MNLKLDLFHLQQCWIQARVFERADKAGYDMEAFAAAFMASEAAEGLDADYDRMQWAGEAYVLESVIRESGLKPDAAGRRVYDREAIFWAGFIYRFWNFKTGESSRDIYRMADYRTMDRAYAGYHTLSCDMAVDWLREGKERGAPSA